MPGLTPGSTAGGQLDNTGLSQSLQLLVQGRLFQVGQLAPQGFLGKRFSEEHGQDLDGNSVKGSEQVCRPSVHLYSKLEYRYLRQKGEKRSAPDPLEVEMFDSASHPAAGRDSRPKTIRIVYTNYRGETAEREVLPQRLWFGATEWHPEEQWLMDAIDIDKGAPRSFALRDIQSYCG